MAVSLHNSTIALYDTLALTKKGSPGLDFKMLNLDEWDAKETGKVKYAYSKNLPLNVSGDNYNGKLFVGYSVPLSSIKISCSLPKLVYGSSLYEIQPEDEPKVTEAIHSTINDFLDIDLSSMEVYRLDNSCNLDMPYSTSRYINAIIHATDRQVGRKHKSEYSGESVSFINKAEGDLFYDKIADEIRIKGKEKDAYVGDFIQKNMLRSEFQYRGKNSIASKLRYGRKLKYSDLFTQEIVNKTLQLRRETLPRILKNADTTFNYGNNLRSLELMKAKNKNSQAINDWFCVRAMQSGLTVDMVVSIMKDSGYTRQAIYKRVQKLKSLQEFYVSDVDLLNEIQEQLELKSVA